MIAVNFERQHETGDKSRRDPRGNVEPTRVVRFRGDRHYRQVTVQSQMPALYVPLFPRLMPEQAARSFERHNWVDDLAEQAVICPLDARGEQVPLMGAPVGRGAACAPAYFFLHLMMRHFIYSVQIHRQFIGFLENETWRIQLEIDFPCCTDILASD